MSLERSTKINGAKYFSIQRADGSWTDPLNQQAIHVRTFVPEGIVVEQYDTVSEVVEDIIDNSKFDIPELPPVGTLVEEDALYSHDSSIYRVRQSHNVTIYDPDDVPALFTIYRKESGTMDWIAGEQVEIGMKRTYEGVIYECFQSHQTQVDWTPPSTLNVLWLVYVETTTEAPATTTEAPATTTEQAATTTLAGVDEWAAGVSYTVGDLVAYGGITYSCRQSHTSQAHWTPPAVLSLWLPQ